MKTLAYSLIALGLALAIAGVWTTRIQLRRDFQAQITSLRPPEQAGQSARPSARSLRNAAIGARERVNRALSELRSIKTSMIDRSRHAERAARSLSEARRSLEGLTRLAEEMNTAALQVEADARDVLVAYEKALNQAIDEAIHEPAAASWLSMKDATAVIGASVGVAGLMLSWRSDRVERVKKGLEIEHLRRELSVSGGKAPV